MTNYWRVASYGYPNPFGDKNSIRSWEIFKSFVEHDSYGAVKGHWASRDVAERLSSNSVESRKASLEEFGLLYVLSHTDKVVITPGGRQLLEAAEKDDVTRFAWVGINLLMRFPLNGPPRSTNTSNTSSDFPIYNFMYSALCELGNYVWFEELLRVLGTVTSLDEARDAVNLVRDLRTGSKTFDTFAPMPSLKGAFYNSMNQVLNHLGLAGLLLFSTREEPPYNRDFPRRDAVHANYREMVRLAIGERAETLPDDDCSMPDQFIGRIPVVPHFDTEQDYFAYLGAAVPDMEQAKSSVEQRLPQVLFGQENVSVLTEAVHYIRGENSIVGEVATLCRISRGQRLVLSHDSEWTYKVRDKQRTSGGQITVELARSKPISNAATILPLFEERTDE